MASAVLTEKGEIKTFAFSSVAMIALLGGIDDANEDAKRADGDVPMEDGVFVFTTVPPGRYRVRVARPRGRSPCLSACRGPGRRRRPKHLSSGAERLTVATYGEAKPIASNRTKRGRHRNRRVEFVVIEVDGRALPASSD